MPFARIAASAAAIIALLIPTTAHAAPAAEPGETVTLPVRDALAGLPVRPEDRTGYERTKLQHWVDADKDGCNTRAEVPEVPRLAVAASLAVVVDRERDPLDQLGVALGGTAEPAE
ncbi:hypothetical protein ABZ864_47180 [Streptomyces sp. NPDC047082]|uniref:hypothetical protein n=1 Tax=Streptomyces sp. NPDC047082 TaxID=3155259 RepID=UPI0034033F4F